MVKDLLKKVLENFLRLRRGSLAKIFPVEPLAEAAIDRAVSHLLGTVPPDLDVLVPQELLKNLAWFLACNGSSSWQELLQGENSPLPFSLARQFQF